jgi:exosortase/archaeosortase family protein
LGRSRKRKSKLAQRDANAAPRRADRSAGRSVASRTWTETHGRDLRFLVIFGVLMAGYYAASTTTVVTTRFFPWYLETTAQMSASILSTCGYDDIAANGQALVSKHGSIAVERGCDAIAPTALFVSAVLASPAPTLSKLPAVFGGGFILMVINIVRIITLFLTAVHWKAAFDVMHLDIWQALFILIAILLWALWASWTTQRRKRLTDAATAHA